MEKPKSFKESMADIKTQFKEDQKRSNDKFKASRERDKIKNAQRNKAPKPKPRRNATLDSTGGKNDAFNVFAQMILGLILSIPIFLIGIFAIVFIVMLVWSMIF